MNGFDEISEGITKINRARAALRAMRSTLDSLDIDGNGREQMESLIWLITNEIGLGICLLESGVNRHGGES